MIASRTVPILLLIPSVHLHTHDSGYEKTGREEYNATSSFISAPEKRWSIFARYACLSEGSACMSSQHLPNLSVVHSSTEKPFNITDNCCLRFPATTRCFLLVLLGSIANDALSSPAPFSLLTG